MTRSIATVAIVGAAAVLCAKPSAAQDVTYASDIARILDEKCAECHRPGSIAPMSLLTYDEVRRYASRIRYRVENRIMPPWGLNPHAGIQDYKNNRDLTDAERAEIVAWIDAGSPLGDPSAVPPTPDFPDGDFFWYLGEELGEPDMVIPGPTVSRAADGPDEWNDVLIPTGLTEAKWLRAVEIRPSNERSRRVIHHALARLVQDEESITGVPEEVSDEVGGPGLLQNYAAGAGGHVFKPDAGKLMLPGSAISWEVHTTAKGLQVDDASVTLGLWFRDSPPPYRTILKTYTPRNANGQLDIPPGRVAVHQGTWVMPGPVRLESFQPHMHMRGKAMMTEAIYPDGHREVLTFVDNFQWNFQTTYIFDDDSAPLLPKGTVLVVTSWHDNTAENPNNPDPNQWIGWGARKVDEMSIAWFEMTYLDQDYFDRLVAERQRRPAAP
jgi:mono/diheme cytochrome c family protein